MTKVFIDGSEGTTGLRIFERFEERSDVELMPIDAQKRKDAAWRREMLNACDIAFLCLPDAAAVESSALIENPRVRVLDTSTAHRTDPAWAYGFPELSKAQRARIREGRRVAVPGCHASGFIALAYPLVEAGIIESEAVLSCFSLTGYSGGGKKLIAQYEDAQRAKEFAAWRAYAMGQQHKHLKEMAYVSKLKTPPVFSPVLGDFYSGMLLTIPLCPAMMKKTVSAAALKELYGAHYANERFVRVVQAPENGMIAANKLSGLDYMEISVCGNDERMTLSACFDNLGKGASGAAVQCMNLMLGLPEETRLKL